MKQFLETFDALPDEDFCLPPGLGGVWMVEWIRKGLNRGALVVHTSGYGLATVPGPEFESLHREMAYFDRHAPLVTDERRAKVREQAHTRVVHTFKPQPPDPFEL